MYAYYTILIDTFAQCSQMPESVTNLRLVIVHIGPSEIQGLDDFNINSVNAEWNYCLIWKRIGAFSFILVDDVEPVMCLAHFPTFTDGTCRTVQVVTGLDRETRWP